MSKDEQWLLKEKYGGMESEGFHADCERLKAGEPLAYVIGWVPFLDCTIWLDSKPLIPRPETEFWVEKAIVEIRSGRAAKPRVLDLCAGSGCNGVAVAHHVPTATMQFTEIEADHLPTIAKNLDAAKIDCTRYQVWQSDLFDAIEGSFDYILSNPPYIDPALDRTEASVKVYEPEVALYGGRGGMEVIERIITAAPTYLIPAGQLWLEHEPEQTTAIQSLAKEYGFTSTTHTDQYGVERYSVLVLQ